MAMSKLSTPFTYTPPLPSPPSVAYNKDESIDYFPLSVQVEYAVVNQASQYPNQQ